MKGAEERGRDGMQLILCIDYSDEDYYYGCQARHQSRGVGEERREDYLGIRV